ncbi:VID27 cytoplasmic protein [Colletotrichum acutatum]
MSPGQVAQFERIAKECQYQRKYRKPHTTAFEVGLEQAGHEARCEKPLAIPPPRPTGTIRIAGSSQDTESLPHTTASEVDFKQFKFQDEQPIRSASESKIRRHAEWLLVIGSSWLLDDCKSSVASNGHKEPPAGLLWLAMSVNLRSDHRPTESQPRRTGLSPKPRRNRSSAVPRAFIKDSRLSRTDAEEVLQS